MGVRVGIECCAGWVEGVGELGEVFAGWREGRGMRAVQGHAEWREMVWPVVEEVVRCAGKGIGAAILGTTKGDVGREVAWMRAVDAGQAGGAELGGVEPTLGGTLREMMEGVGLGGAEGWVVSTACSSGLVALVDAAIAVAAGQFERVLVVAADVGDSFIEEGFGALKAISASGVCRPFDVRRDGLMLGAGVAGCVVGRLSERSVCEISGFGVSNDAVHMTAPDREGRGLARAMTGALERAGLTPGEVDVVFLHGTGTRYNDAMEAVAVGKVFGGSERARVTAVKGMIGHTLGASGLVEALLGVRMIQEGVVPGVVGMDEPEFAELPAVRVGDAGGPPYREVRHVLKTASGFGGMNAAVVLSRIGL